MELEGPRKALDEAGAETLIVSPLERKVRARDFTDWGDKFPVDVNLEVALVSTLREVMLKGAHEFEWHRLLGLSLLLVVLGGLLALERWAGRWRSEVSETDAR